MDTTSPLRTALIGCGWHGASLAEAIGRSPALELVACADPNEAAANTVAAGADGVSTHRSVEQLLAEREVDAVVIATPHHVLAPAALAALRAGKHVMAEKPVALNDREAEELERAASETGATLMAGYSMRFSMGRYVKALIDAGVVGDVLSASASFCCGSLDEDWIAAPETGGGPLLFIGSHAVDMLLWYIGDEPEAVYADVTRRADTGADKTSAFQVRFRRGAVAQCFVSQAAAHFAYDIKVRGSAGEVALRGRNFLQFEIEVVSSAVDAYAEPTIIRPSVRRDNIHMMLVPELNEFASAIREQRAPAVTIADARRVLRVLDGVIQSEYTQQPVQLLSVDAKPVRY